MLRYRLLAIRIIAVLSVAFAAGHMVQSMRDAPLAASAGIAAAGDDPAEMPALSGIRAVSATTSGADTACAVRLDLAAAPEAMIALSLYAPCNMGEEVVIRHSGLAFSGSIGADGGLRLSLPAMTTEALVAAYVGNSEIVLGKVAVADVKEYFRLAVHMPSETRFDLRADEDGQVYVASRQVPGMGPHRVLQLGQGRTENQLVTLVYSAALKDMGQPELTVELRITPETCGRTISAEIITSRLGRADHVGRDVTVPLCGTSGDILLLKNLLPDMTLASPE